jgi:predicted flap endonuclease-1-like 5' DNA nuclease
VAPDAIRSTSIFAGLVSLAVAVAERDGDVAAAPPPQPPATQASADPVGGPSAEEASASPTEAQADASPDAPHAARPTVDPPLAEIGFGPGMLIRLSQLGLHTIGDLAQADASGLRIALGDISRLIDVETWINNARQNANPRT